MSPHAIAGTVRPRGRRGSVVGYRVVASYDIALGNGEKPVTVPATRTARLQEDGVFELDLGDGIGVPQAPVVLTVSGPDGSERASRILDGDDLTRPIRFRIATPPPVAATGSDDPALGARIRVTGVVVSRTGSDVPGGLPIVITGTTTDGVETPLVVTTTLPGGGFAADWVGTELATASATVAGGEAVPVALDDDGRLARHLLIVFDGSVTSVDDDSCQGDGLPLAADQADLTTHPQLFSQDLTGGCIDLTVPDRSLEEFTYYSAVRTTEPRITGLMIEPKTVVPADLVSDLLGVSIASEALGITARTSTKVAQSDFVLDAAAAYDLVRSDAPPSLYEIAENSWSSVLDDTVTVIGSTLQTDVDRAVLNLDNAIDWDETPTVYLALDLAFGRLLTFKQSFKSAGFSLGKLLYSLPLAPGQKRQIAILDWDRRTASSRTESLEYEERLDSLLTRDRDIFELVDSSLDEDIEASSSNRTRAGGGGIGGGAVGMIGAIPVGFFAGVAGGSSSSNSASEQAASRTFAAETMQNLSDRVSQRSTSLRDQRSTVVQSVSQGETLTAETEFVGNYNRCHSMTVEYFQVLRHFQVTHELAAAQECLFVPLPMSHFDNAKALRWREVLSRRIKNRGLARGFRAMERIADDWVGWDVPDGAYSEEAPEVVDGELRISFIIPRPRDDEDGHYQVDMWQDLIPWIDTDPLALYTAKYNEQTQAAKDLTWRNEDAPKIAAAMLDDVSLAFVTSDGGEVDVPIDPTLVSRYQEGAALYVTLNPAGGVPAVPRQDITHVKIRFDGAPLPEGARAIVHSAKIRYSTDNLTAVMVDRDRVLDDLDAGDSVVIAAPLTPAEQRDPREEDRELAARLVAHLNDNLEYYHHVIWTSLDTERRFMLLDAVLVPGLDGRSVASVCENRIVGIVGNSLVLPAAPGVRLDPTFSGEDENGDPVSLIELYATDPAPPIRISMPTRGVHAEAVLGACNACEEIDDSRYWRWTNDGMLELPGIEAVGTDSRASEEPDLTPTPLPSPIVSIQNAPAAPDPTGLAGVLGLMSSSDLFRDITGLEGTQRNAGSAYQSVISAAAALGDEAYKLASQTHLGTNGQRLLGQMLDANASGLLTDDALEELSAGLLSGLVGSGTDNGPTVLSDPAIADALSGASSGSVSATQNGAAVEVEFGSGDGVPHEEGYTPSAPLDLWAMVRAAEPDEFSYDQLEVAFGEALAPAIEHGYVAKDDDGAVLVEQNLRIVYPENGSGVPAEGAAPVVFIAHGSATGWTEDGATQHNHHGFGNLQWELAKRGIVSVSVDLNAAHFLSQVAPRTLDDLVLRAVDRVRALGVEPTSVLNGHLDDSAFGFIAHSDGATSVIRALGQNAVMGSERFDVNGVLLVAPVAYFDARIDGLETDSLMVLVSGLDGEAPAGKSPYESGQLAFGGEIYDIATSERRLLAVANARHRGFNSVWTDVPDTLVDVTEGVDEDRLLSDEDHQVLLAEYATAYMAHVALGDDTDIDLIDGNRANSLETPVSVQTSAAPHRLLIDSMAAAGPEQGERSLDLATIASSTSAVVGGIDLAELTDHQGMLCVVEPVPAASVVYQLESNPWIVWAHYDALRLQAAAIVDIDSAAAIEAAVLPGLIVRMVDADGASNEVALDDVRLSVRTYRPVPHVVRHIDDTIENVTNIRLLTYEIPMSDLLRDLTYIERLEVATDGAFPTHQVFTDIELIRA